MFAFLKNNKLFTTLATIVIVSGILQRVLLFLVEQNNQLDQVFFLFILLTFIFVVIFSVFLIYTLVKALLHLKQIPFLKNYFFFSFIVFGILYILTVVPIIEELNRPFF